jgi:hypothetical protein
VKWESSHGLSSARSPASWQNTIIEREHVRPKATLHTPDGDVDQGTHDVIPVEPDRQVDHRRTGPQDQLRSIRAVFVDATDGYSAVDRLRARGFRIDLAVSITGDLIVSIDARPTQADEIAALVAAHDGRVERPLGSSARSNLGARLSAARRPTGVRP